MTTKIDSKFHNKNGTLTAYAFACGYVEREENPDIRLDLWRESTCWHVRAHNFAEHKRIFWNAFRTLGEARRFFRQQKKIIFGKV